MSLESRIYSVLVVSSSEAFNNATREMLPPSKYHPVCFTSNASEAKRYLVERSFDFVIINSPLPDDNGTRFAIDCCRSLTSVVLLMLRAETYAELYSKVVSYGVFTLPKPTSKVIMMQALDWLASGRERLRKLEKKTLSVEERMEEIRIVNRAKILLVSELHMTEPEAHRYIEKQAMDRCITKREAAETVIKTYS
ncbi:MAG: ANTAR domain-containing protein [Eubacteriales bacterium]|nr:ANTAR domain-containing protein [Eubacteriales bacterium]